MIAAFLWSRDHALEVAIVVAFAALFAAAFGTPIESELQVLP